MKTLLAHWREWLNVHARWFYPAVIILIAMLANGVSMYFEDGICDDAAKYHAMITNWIKYDDIYYTSKDVWASTAVPPFFLWCVKTLSRLLHVEIFTAARILNFICGALSPLIFYFFIRAFEVKRIFAFFCALTLACHPASVYITTIMTRDCLCFFLLMVLLLLTVQGILQKRMWEIMPAGIIFAAAVLTRYEALEMLPFFVIFLAFCVWAGKISPVRAFGACGIFLLFTGAGLFLLAYIMEFELEYSARIFIRYWERIRGVISLC